MYHPRVYWNVLSLNRSVGRCVSSLRRPLVSVSFLALCQRGAQRDAQSPSRAPKPSLWRPRRATAHVMNGFLSCRRRHSHMLLIVWWFRLSCCSDRRRTLLTASHIKFSLEVLNCLCLHRTSQVYELVLQRLGRSCPLAGSDRIRSSLSKSDHCWPPTAFLQTLVFHFWSC
jgi:hypothetical protein